MNPEPTTPDTPTAFGPVAPLYDILMAGVPYRFWVDYLQTLWARHGPNPRTVLDLACGTGAVSRLLAARGLDVVGVDLSAAMLDAARPRADAEGLAIPFYQQDAAELSLAPRTFDAVICLFDSLNNILEGRRLAQAFGRVFEHLAPGGTFVFDLNTEYALAQGMFNQSCSRRGEPLHYRWRSNYDAEARLCTIHMRFSYDPGDGHRREFTEVHRQRAYHKDEIQQWLRRVGFAEVVVYDGYTLEPPKKRSDRLFYAAVKAQVEK